MEINFIKKTKDLLVFTLMPLGQVEPDPMNWVTLSLQQDLAWVEGRDPCAAETQQAGEFSCFRSDDAQYLGTTRAEGASVGPGFRLATTRVLLMYERRLLPFFTLGARAGYAFRGGGPKPVGADAHAFLPWHAEARLTYWPLDTPRASMIASPFVFLSTGLAQVDARFDVRVREDESVSPPSSQLDNPRQQTLDAYRKMGQGFAGIGAGVAVRVGGLSYRVAIAGGAFFPADGLSSGVDLGVGYGF